MAHVQLRKPRGRYEIVDFSNKFAGLNEVQGFVHHRPPLKRSLRYGFPRDKRYLGVTLVAAYSAKYGVNHFWLTLDYLHE